MNKKCAHYTLIRVVGEHTLINTLYWAFGTATTGLLLPTNASLWFSSSSGIRYKNIGDSAGKLNLTETS